MIGVSAQDCRAQSGVPSQNRVDLLLALTVDVSLSMDLEEQRLQRDGYVAALRDPLVWKAIGMGPTGRIAITYIEWAGVATQAVVIPWTLVDGEAAAKALADALADQPISRARFTSISGVLSFAARALETSPFTAPRRVIDVSGDGPNNQGVPVLTARQEVLDKDIVINGLPIMLKFGGVNSYFDLPNLDDYYADCVIGGPGAFSLPVTETSQLAETIRRKLVLEISGLPAGHGRLWPAQAGSSSRPPADCLIGEKLWRDYQRGRLHE
jgi:hypothetical protein